jgi:hypothetical protein
LNSARWPLPGQETVAGDSGVVDKDILAAFASDEAVSLPAVEPLDRALNSIRHCFASQANED